MKYWHRYDDLNNILLLLEGIDKSTFLKSNNNIIRSSKWQIKKLHFSPTILQTLLNSIYPKYQRNLALQKLPWLPCWTLGVLKIQLIGKNLNKRNRKLSWLNLLTKQDNTVCLITKNHKISGREKDLYWGDYTTKLH